MTAFRLPSLKRDLTHMMRDVQRSLDRLPQSFSDEPQTKLLSLCADFVLEIGEHTKGDTNHPKFLQDLHEEFQKLAEEIVDTKPNFGIKPKSMSELVLMQQIPIAAPPPPSSLPPCIFSPPVATNPNIHPERQETQLGKSSF
jgi:hypothetical protein